MYCQNSVVYKAIPCWKILKLFYILLFYFNSPIILGNADGSKTTTSHSIIGKPDTNLSVAKQRSFDVETSLGIGGCYSNYGHENPRTTRTKPTSTTPATVAAKQPQTKETYMPDIARSCSFIQRRNTFQV